jgi:hypothetical protein
VADHRVFCEACTNHPAGESPFSANVRQFESRFGGDGLFVPALCLEGGGNVFGSFVGIGISVSLSGDVGIGGLSSSLVR